MRHILTISLLFSAIVSFAQVDSVSLKYAMADFDKALIDKNEKALSHLLNDQVSYGHSNGWVQSKSDIINDLKSGKLTYNKIEHTLMTIAAISGDWATVRTNTNANVASTNVPAFDIKLQILQVWIKTKDGWQLIARQGVRLQ